MKTVKEWEDEIRSLSLDKKTPEELTVISASAATKRIRVSKVLQEIQLFPGAKKKEIYDSLVQAGEIQAEPEGATSLSSTNRVKVDKIYQSQVQSYSDKIDRLTQFVTVSNKASELRK